MRNIPRSIWRFYLIIRFFFPHFLVLGGSNKNQSMLVQGYRLNGLKPELIVRDVRYSPCPVIISLSTLSVSCMTHGLLLEARHELLQRDSKP